MMKIYDIFFSIRPINVLIWIFFQLNPWPEFIQKRIEIFDTLKAQYDAEVAGKSMKMCVDEGSGVGGWQIFDLIWFALMC